MIFDGIKFVYTWAPIEKQDLSFRTVNPVVIIKSTSHSIDR